MTYDSILANHNNPNINCYELVTTMVQAEYLILMYLIGILSVLWTMRLMAGALVREETAILWAFSWPLIPVLFLLMRDTKGKHWKR